jgi:transposase
MKGKRRRLVEVSAAELAAVEARLARGDLSRRERERLELVKGRALGAEIAALTRWSGRSARTVWRWLELFRAEGMAALGDAPRSGRPPQADAGYRAALAQAVGTPPRDLGLGFDVWTSARLSVYLAETTGVRLAAGWVRVLLHQAGFVSGRPTHTLHHLQDPEAVAQVAAHLAAVGEKGAGGAGAL